MSTITTDVLTPRQQIEAIETALNAELVERRAEIYGALLALVSRSSLFFLGSPGIAKTMLVNRLMARIDEARYFDVLMGRFTQPEELVGPPSLLALEQGRFEHLIEGYLPTAHAVFLDEIWKASSSILNTLLMAINERRYRHGAEMIDIPLAFISAASNEMPADDSLNALYDRFLLRFEVSGVQDMSSFMTMLQLEHDENPPKLMTWADVEQAQREVAAVEIPERVIGAIADLKRKLVAKGIELTDRRYVQSLRIIKAAAWFDDCKVADTDHMAPLEHVFWHAPSQRAEVSKLVLELANPLEVEAAELLATIRELDGQIDGIQNNDERMRLGREVHQKLNRAAEELKDLQQRAGSGQRRIMKVAEVKDKLAQVTDRILLEVFHFAEQDAASLKKD